MNRKDIDISLSHQTAFDVIAPDGKRIFVYCNRAGDEPSKKAIVIAHGLGGTPNGYMHMIARNYFNAMGYDVYRMAFYWDGPEYRILHECSVSIHAQDLNAVIAHVRDKHNKLYVCGHSYGGLTLVFANPQVDAISFWDPSYQPWERFLSKATAPALDGKTHLLRWEYLITLGQGMMDEAKNLTRDVAKSMTSNITVPSQVAVAGESWLKADTQMLFDDLNCQKEIFTVQGAGHTFVEGQVVFELLEKTHKWFDRF